MQVRFGKDLATVATLANTANVLVIHPSLGVSSLAARAQSQRFAFRARPGSVAWRIGNAPTTSMGMSKKRSRIAATFNTCIAGEPGTGKSQLSIALAAE